MDLTSLITLRTSERTCWKRCPQKWEWQYVEGLRSKGLPDKNMWFGTGIHLALAFWYLEGTKRGAKPVDTWMFFYDREIKRLKKLSGSDTDWALKDFVDFGELGSAMCTEYIRYYGKDEHLFFLATELEGSVKIGSNVRYYFTWDGIALNQETDEIELIEHKTCASIRTGHLALDEQASSYWAVAQTKLKQMQITLPNQNIVGIRYNFLRKAMPDTRPRNPSGKYLNKPGKQNYINAITKAAKLSASEELRLQKWTIPELFDYCQQCKIKVEGEVSKQQPLPAFQRELVLRRPSERKMQIQRIKEEATVMQMQRDGSVPIWKTPRATGHDACAGCEFYTMCTLHESGADWETYKRRMFVAGVADTKTAYEGV